MNNRNEIANLIADMALRGASKKELEHVIKQSMDIIDAERGNNNDRK